MSRDMFKQVRVSVRGQKTYDIRWLLKKCDFKFSKHDKCWSRMYPNSYTIEHLDKEWWVSQLKDKDKLQKYFVEFDTSEKKESHMLLYCNKKKRFTVL